MKSIVQVAVFMCILSIVSGTATPLNLGASEKTAPDAASQTIWIKADNLKVNTQSNQAVFSGNAIMNQGSTQLSADRLTISYRKDSRNTDTTSDAIDMILAEGNVRIEMDDGIAVAERAEYFAGEGKLVLSGPGTKVILVQGEMSCGMIVYLRDQGTMECRKDGDQQVKAVIKTTERGLN